MDKKLTQQIADWLNTKRDLRNIADGALMLLRLNNNRYLYGNILRRPDKFHDKLEYELRKHLRIRLDNKTRRDVILMEREVMPQAEETLTAQPVLAVEDELPKGKIAKGRRPDHDSLPASIRALWDDNLRTYKTIKDLFERLKAMENAQPCDRYEYLVLLAEADKKYRDNLAAYDAYVPGEEADNGAKPEIDAESKRKINAARKTLSKYKKIYANALEINDKDRQELARAKVLEMVETIKTNGGTVGIAVTTELTNLGILTA